MWKVARIKKDGTDGERVEVRHYMGPRRANGTAVCSSDMGMRPTVDRTGDIQNSEWWEAGWRKAWQNYYYAWSPKYSDARKRIKADTKHSAAYRRLAVARKLPHTKKLTDAPR
jgi:hypothetical protein